MAAFDGEQVTLPALYIVGERDFVVTAFQRDIVRQSKFVPKLRPAITLAGCGHWTAQERPTEVSAAMIDFLRSV
jgi:pimeloyl-ACP methyl ester carboxylesterase